jgi:hypothetical protein
LYATVGTIREQLAQLKTNAESDDATQTEPARKALRLVSGYFNENAMLDCLVKLLHDNDESSSAG